MRFKTLQNMMRASAVVGLVLLCVAVAPPPAGAADEAALDPIAMERFQRMSDYLAAAKTFTVTARTLYDEVEESGIKLKNGVRQEIFVRRPDKLHIRARLEDGIEREVWFDGKTLSVLFQDGKAYTQIPISGTIDQMLDHLNANFDITIPMSDLLWSNIDKALREYLISAVYLGTKQVGRTLCDHVSFETPAADVQIWIEAGDRPVPRRLVINYVELPGQPEYVSSIRRWQLNVDLDDSVFAFTPPAGAKKIDIAKLPAAQKVD